MGNDKIFENMPDIAKEIIPDVYQDGLKPATTEVGKLLERPFKVINSLFQPVDIWLAKREHNLERIKKILEQKLEGIPEEQLIAPEPYIAIPALEALTYSIDSDELRNLYANLLACAMIKEKSGEVHPSFIEIIKQMSPLDAVIFKNIMERSITPIIHLSSSVEGKRGTENFHYNLSWINEDYELVNVSLSNLKRLGLIEIPDDGSYIDDRAYDSIRQSDIYQNIVDKLKREYIFKGIVDIKINEDKRFIRKNAVSKAFYDICV